MEAIIAVGSNYNATENIGRLLKTVQTMPELTLLAASRTYRTAAVGTTPEASLPHFYLNTALLIETSLPPVALKERLRQIEEQLGRTRSTPGLVAIDLDLILVRDLAQQSMADKDILPPHPDLLRYAHVAVPCAEVAPDWIHPTQHRRLRSIADSFTQTEMEIVEP
jgi:2-amino-4-hydroxy-6-hydroxymethyldihydropteridine diphosphokinase